MVTEPFTSPLHIVIPDDRLRRATRIAAARKGISIRAYVEGLLREDAEISSALAYADAGADMVGNGVMAEVAAV